MNELPPRPDPPPPAAALALARGRRSSIPLHLALLLVTFLTLAVAGGIYWEGHGPVTLGPLLQAEVLLSRIVYGWRYALWVLVILGSHELGHYAACRYYGIPATLPFFIPGIPPVGSFGAVIRIRGRIPDRRALFDVAAAGPIAGFITLLPVLVYGLLNAVTLVGLDPPLGSSLHGRPLARLLVDALLGHGPRIIGLNGIYGAAWVGMLVTSLNLFPVGQLDGGHAVYAISRRLHRVLSWLTIFGLATLVAVQLFVLREIPAYLLWLAILFWMRDRHPALIDETRSIGAARLVVASLLLLIFALCFIALPIRLVS